MCIFRYSNQSTYGLWERSTFHVDYIRENVLSYHQFNLTLSLTVEDLINKAAFQSQNNGTLVGFATMEARVTGDEVFYSLAQCTPDIVGVNCSQCLRLLKY
ncbi:Cysteine-rich receptor-like protein kinase 25 [Bienertia sinuspersici]